jgi:hypothetical protein
MNFDECCFLFMYDDSTVGCFEESEYPAKSGEFKYSAFRGYGHYEMQMKLKESGNALCYYDLDKERVWFEVVNSNKGIVKLTNFRQKNRANNEKVFKFEIKECE